MNKFGVANIFHCLPNIVFSLFGKEEMIQNYVVLDEDPRGK